MEIKVGDVLWCHDYRSNSKRWFEKIITGETKKSWILGDGFNPYKILKIDLTENQGAYGRRNWYTPEGREQYIWIHTHAREIGSRVENVRDVALLKQIAGLIGYHEETK